MHPNKTFAQANSLSRKSFGEFDVDHVQLIIYGPNGVGTRFSLSVEQTRQLVTSLSLALGDLAEKRALETTHV